MSIRQMYAIRDVKAGFFSDPIGHNHDEEAKRQFVGIACNDKSSVHKFPADFDLYRIGVLDVPTGRISSLDVPELVLSGLEAKRIGAANVD